MTELLLQVSVIGGRFLVRLSSSGEVGAYDIIDNGGLLVLVMAFILVRNCRDCSADGSNLDFHGSS